MGWVLREQEADMSSAVVVQAVKRDVGTGNQAIHIISKEEELAVLGG